MRPVGTGARSASGGVVSELALRGGEEKHFLMAHPFTVSCSRFSSRAKSAWAAARWRGVDGSNLLNASGVLSLPVDDG